ncbi:biotinidase [Nerophis ophidion]|uniref:biotinidase n=1 Tax=Nerophis ophidion TaxID=159077 RepID=UPI002ADFC0C7|nr:biotinidase [Nerophis ophidion]
MSLQLTLMAAWTFTAGVGETWRPPDSSYVAAVYEHHLIQNPRPLVPVSRQQALQHMQENLDVYEAQAALAARQGADIVVFPEDGLQGFNFSRSSISGYLETVPDPREEKWNPCTEPRRFNNTEVLQQLSCMARRHNLYVVANMADLQPCPLRTDPASSCPPDGRWQFNTDVVFRSDGLLVARYHKHNLYFEGAFDTPPRMEVVTFHTPFAGTFGLITCFDILFFEPTIVLLERGVRQLIFPTAWMNQLPLLDTIQFQRAFSLGANVTLLAANIRHDGLIMTGSGVYTPFTAAYHHAQTGDPEEGRLIVARVPVLEEGGVKGWSTDPQDCHQDICAWSPPPTDPQDCHQDICAWSPPPTDPQDCHQDSCAWSPPPTDPQDCHQDSCAWSPPPTDPQDCHQDSCAWSPPPTDPQDCHQDICAWSPPPTDPQDCHQDSCAWSPPPTDPQDCHQDSCAWSPPPTDPQDCHQDSCAWSPPPTFTASMMYDPFQFVLLKHTEGQVEVCHGTFCCHLHFQQFPVGVSKELYALGAFEGTHTVNGRYALQVCAVVRCAGMEAASCGQEVEEADTKFNFTLEATFGSKYVYPSVLVSAYVLEQPEHLEKTAGGRMTMKHGNTAGGLITASLYGRVYHLDKH